MRAKERAKEEEGKKKKVPAHFFRWSPLFSSPHSVSVTVTVVKKRWYDHDHDHDPMYGFMK